MDDEYQPARVNEKPEIVYPNLEGKDSSSNDSEIPILGMFRNNPEMLAKDLAAFIDELNSNGYVKRKVLRVLTREENKKFNSDDKTTLINYRDSGFEMADSEDEIFIELDEESGSPEDIAFLTYSPKENTKGGASFPLLLKRSGSGTHSVCSCGIKTWSNLYGYRSFENKGKRPGNGHA